MGELLHFPRRRPLEAVPEPQSIHADLQSDYDRRVDMVKASRFEDFVRELSEAQSRLLAEPGIRLTDDELEALQKYVDPWRCDKCGDPVYPKHSLWWSAVHGGLHMLECEPRPLEAV